MVTLNPREMKVDVFMNVWDEECRAEGGSARYSRRAGPPPTPFSYYGNQALLGGALEGSIKVLPQSSTAALHGFTFSDD